MWVLIAHNRSSRCMRSVLNLWPAFSSAKRVHTSRICPYFTCQLKHASKRRLAINSSSRILTTEIWRLLLQKLLMNIWLNSRFVTTMRQLISMCFLFFQFQSHFALIYLVFFIPGCSYKRTRFSFYFRFQSFRSFLAHLFVLSTLIQRGKI